MPRMVGEKSSILPVAIGGIIIAAVAVAVWYATRGSQTEEAPASGAAPSALVTPPRGPEAASDNATSDNSTSDTEIGSSADNAMGADNSAGAMGGNTMGADNAMAGNAMGGAGNTSPMGSAGQNSLGGMNGAGNSASPMGAPNAMGGNAMPVPPPVTNR